MCSSVIAIPQLKINHFEISDAFPSDALEILGLRSPVYDWDRQTGLSLPTLATHN